VIGDVAGSGLPAAVIMGGCAARCAPMRWSPGIRRRLLGRLDRKMQHFEPDALATVLYAVIDPALDQMHLCLAGHFRRSSRARGSPPNWPAPRQD